jgi:aryl sulfotransferase
MAQAQPQKTRTYNQHPMIDGDRWSAYNHRAGDIVITTSYKAGTTWMQTIVANLLYQTGEFPAPVTAMAPWLDMALPPLDEVAAGLEAQTDRRFIKTHLPLDGIPFFDTAKYIYVGRDGRDVFMSMWNHHSGYSDDIKAYALEVATAVGRTFPTDYSDLHALYADWISHSWYDWEADGFPYWSHFSHVQSWWDYRHLDNIHFVHFADLLADPEKAIRAIAGFLNIQIEESLLPGIIDRISFGSMKKNFTNIMPEAADIWQGGGNRFMNKGTNGRWRGVLTETELAQYDTAASKALTPDAARWLEHGEAV